MKRTHLAFGAAFVAVSLAASACSSNDESRKAAAAQASVGCPTADPAASRADADRSAILRYGDAPASSLDPIRQVEGSEGTVLRTIYDTLVTLDAAGKAQPGLATSWEMIDDDTMELKLPDDVTFQDGTKFDAEAVKFNIERGQNDPASTIATSISTIKKVRAVDPTTVQLDLSPANPGALPITFSERPGMMVSPAAVKAAGSSEKFNLAPVGAGAYQVELPWQPVESIKVRAWDGYWNADNRLLGGIDFKRLSFDASVGALKSGDLDLQIVEVTEVKAVCAEDDLRATLSPTDELRMLVINSAWEPFTDKRVRQALAYGLNREAISEVMTLGVADVAHQWFRDGQLPFNPEVEDDYAYDPEKAKELLEEAGFGDGLSFKAEIGTGVTSYIRMGEVIQAELKKIGVEMDLQLVDRNDLLGRVYGIGGADIKVGASPLAVAAVRQPSERFVKYLYEDGVLNPSKQEIPGLQELVTEADSTLDEGKRAELFQQATQLVSDEVMGGIPLYFVPGVTAYGSHVGGVVKGATRADLDFSSVYITKDAAAVGERE